MPRRIVGMFAGIAGVVTSLGVAYSVYAANDVPGDDAWGECALMLFFSAAWLFCLFDKNVDGAPPARDDSRHVLGPTGSPSVMPRGKDTDG